MYQDLFHALPLILDWQNFLAIVLGVVSGILVGAMPGLSATMAISLLIPFTFGMSPLVALGMMAGIYNGAMYGGSIPAVLLRIPGTPAAVATTFDGYPMAQAGRGGFALQVSVVSSAIGGIASALALMLIAPPLASVTLLFGPAEIFWVAVLGLGSIVFLLGSDLLKGLISAVIGVLLSLVGADSITGYDRFTFGHLQLFDGINVIVLLVGLYALPPAIGLLENAALDLGAGARSLGRGGVLSSIPKLLGYWKTWLRGSVIGIFVGILPGAGGSMGAFLSYDAARRASKNPEHWGNGEPEGVAASETANNADTAAAMIPALTLGIPGTPVAAIVLGGLLVQGMQPGPMLFHDHPDVVFGFMWQFLFSAILLMVLGGSLATNAFSRVLRLPRPFLGPIIFALMVVGVYSVNQEMFDVYLMLGFGVLGYFMEKLHFPLPPVVLGLILGGYAEENLRLALRISGGHWSGLYTHPISQGLIFLLALVVFGPFIKRAITRFVRARHADR